MRKGGSAKPWSGTQGGRPLAPLRDILEATPEARSTRQQDTNGPSHWKR